MSSRVRIWRSRRPYWAQFPGNFRLRARPAAINSRNFAALAPFHTHPAGKADGNHWGSAVALLRTSAGSPYHFNFHAGDVGHTFICGPSGSGKTVVQNFMLAQLEKLGAQQVFIDKDRGAEIFVRACGGVYLTLKTGEPSGFAPFKALDYTPANRAFLASLVRKIATPPDRSLTAQEDRARSRRRSAPWRLCRRIAARSPRCVSCSGSATPAASARALNAGVSRVRSAGCSTIRRTPSRSRPASSALT